MDIVCYDNEYIYIYSVLNVLSYTVYMYSQGFCSTVVAQNKNIKNLFLYFDEV